MPKPFTPSILLIGCGYTLTKLLRLLKPSNVIFTVRSDEALQNQTQYVSHLYQGRSLSLFEKGALKDLFEEFPSIDTIVDSVPPSAPAGEQDLLIGVKNLCEIIAGRQLKRFVYLGTTGVFGTNDGSEVDENSPCTPQNPKAEARLEAERLYAAANPNFVAFRVAAIYGPGRGLGVALKQGTFRLVAGSERWSNRIHVEDLVSAIYAATSYGGILPHALCIADDKPASIREVATYYCNKFGFPLPAEISEEEAKQAEMHSLLSNQRVKNARMKSELKLTLRYPSYIEGAGTEFV